MERSPTALLLFARTPRLGQVKTRLSPFLEQQTIIDLYTCFLRDSVDKLRVIAGVDGFVGVDTPAGLDDLKELGAGLTMFLQQGGDLGARLWQAVCGRRAEGYERVVIVGADSPSVPPEYIAAACAAEEEVVLGPSVDGGYYLIGLRGRAAAAAELFSGIPWGADGVLAATLARLAGGGLRLRLLPVWYDIDRPEDVSFLKTHLAALALSGQPVPAATHAFLQRLEIKTR